MENSNLVQKVVAVMKRVGAIPATGKNQFHGYSYRKHSDIVNALQPALIEAGLIIFVKDVTPIIQDKGHLQAVFTYAITDGKEFMDFKGVGEGIDVSKDGKAGDKAAYKAQTGGMKYALNVLLTLATDAEPEADHGTAAPKAAASQGSTPAARVGKAQQALEKCKTAAELQKVADKIERDMKDLAPAQLQGLRTLVDARRSELSTLGGN